MTGDQTCSSSPFFSSRYSYNRTVRRGYGAGVDVAGAAHVAVQGLEDPDNARRGVVGRFSDRHRCHHRVHTGRQGSGHIRPEAHHRRPGGAVHHQLGNDILRDFRLGTVRGPSDCRRRHRRSHRHRPDVHRRDCRELYQR